jgi:hypothetical protein
MWIRFLRLEKFRGPADLVYARGEYFRGNRDLGRVNAGASNETHPAQRFGGAAEPFGIIDDRVDRGDGWANSCCPAREYQDRTTVVEFGPIRTRGGSYVGGQIEFAEVKEVHTWCRGNGDGCADSSRGLDERR